MPRYERRQLSACRAAMASASAGRAARMSVASMSRPWPLPGPCASGGAVAACRARRPRRMLDIVTATRTVAPDDQLAAALPLLRDTLTRIADEARHTMVVTDADGRVLWWDARHPAVAVRHCWTAVACPVHEPDAGAVVGAVDVTAPAVHPTTPALVSAA